MCLHFVDMWTWFYLSFIWNRTFHLWLLQWIEKCKWIHFLRCVWTDQKVWKVQTKACWIYFVSVNIYCILGNSLNIFSKPCYYDGVTFEVRARIPTIHRIEQRRALQINRCLDDGCMDDRCGEMVVWIIFSNHIKTSCGANSQRYGMQSRPLQ